MATPDNLTTSIPLSDDRTGAESNRDQSATHRSPSPKQNLDSRQNDVLPISDGSQSLRAADMVVSPVPTDSRRALQEPCGLQSRDNFDFEFTIGNRPAAKVYSAICKSTQKHVAIKVINLDSFERNQIDELRRETAVMALSKHPNVLQVYESYVSGSKLHIVMPLATGGSCLDIMKNGFPFGMDEASIATILKSTLEALVYLHRSRLLHRDIKGGNILVDGDGTVLLADFGVSSSLLENGDRGVRNTFVGTPCWMAPEVMEQSGYDYKADIWSFGITAIELAAGQAPHAKLPPLKVLMKILSDEPPTLVRETATHKYSKAFKAMVDLCLYKDPAKRPSAERLLKHEFFTQAKKKEYLVETLLAHVLPLEKRPRKNGLPKEDAVVETEAWDFSTGSLPASVEPPAEAHLQAPPKRHISFGDAVIRDPKSFLVSGGARQSSYVEGKEPHDADQTQPSLLSTSPVPLSDHSFQGIDSTLSLNEETPTTGSDLLVVSNLTGHTANQTTAHSAPTPILTPSMGPKEHRRRRSRFEIQSIGGAPLSRENSVSAHEKTKERDTSPCQTETRKVGRFELTGSSVEWTPTSHSHDSPYLSATNSSGTTSPLASISRGQSIRTVTDPVASFTLTAHLEELVKQNNTQRQMLQDLCHELNFKTRLGQEPKRSYSSQNYLEIPRSPPLDPHGTTTENVAVTIDHLEHLIRVSFQENASLQKENIELRQELQRLHGITMQQKSPQSDTLSHIGD